MSDKPKSRRGFASLSPEERREVARKGGIAAHKMGTAHEFTSEEARDAGRKGGKISRGGKGRAPIAGNDTPVDGNTVRTPDAYEDEMGVV